MAASMALFACMVIVFVSLSARAGRAYLSAPIVFLVAGIVVGRLPFYEGLEGSAIRVVAEVTLALLLFHDAAQLDLRGLRAEWSLSGRLLLVGLPLTIGCGFLLVRGLFPELGVWLALLVAASVAPTDSALGSDTVVNPVIPSRIRRVLNVESGLNDGIATPVVLFAMTAAAGAAQGTSDHGALDALLDIVIGVVFGAGAGLLPGRMIAVARRRGWAEEHLVPVAVLVIPLLGYYGGSAIGGNGFTAAFVAGTAFAATQRDVPRRQLDLQLADLVSALLGCATWMLFGAATATRLAPLVHWETLAFAVLALTAGRILPVALSLVGTGLRLPTLAFVGWFGPRGLPSVVFALIAFESLGQDPGISLVLTVIASTVILSVLAHGVTAAPMTRRYGAWVRRAAPHVECAEDVERAPGPT
jgi:NhaP-type Na+/H+ or K+/H+ antiporter